jgi:hypothetical protein
LGDRLDFKLIVDLLSNRRTSRELIDLQPNGIIGNFSCKGYFVAGFVNLDIEMLKRGIREKFRLDLGRTTLVGGVVRYSFDQEGSN